MKFNKLKALAAFFIITGSVIYFRNGRVYTTIILILKALGVLIFIYALSKDLKKN